MPFLPADLEQKCSPDPDFSSARTGCWRWWHWDHRTPAVCQTVARTEKSTRLQLYCTDRTAIIGKENGSSELKVSNS